jgi:hypothetical protein
MNKYITAGLSVAAIAAYCVLLRYVLPRHDPYFLLGIGVIGYLAWLNGTLAGLLSGVLLIPLTTYIYSQFDLSVSYHSMAYSPAYIAIEILAAVSFGRLRRKNQQLFAKDVALAEANQRLQSALAHVREPGGIYSICTSCRKIKDDDGQWMSVDAYLTEKTKIELSHAICPDCTETYHDQPVITPEDGQADTLP